LGEKPLKSFSVGLKAGLMMGGSGTNKCTSGDCSLIDSNNEVGYTHKVSGGFGADFLWKIGSLVRLGPGAFFVFPSSIERDTPASSSYEVGSDLSIDFVLELAPRVSSAVWLVPRAEIGGTALFPSGDLDNDLRTLRDLCNQSGASGCESVGGVRFGGNGGLGFGALFGVGESVRLRADLLAQLYVVNIYSAQLPSSIGGGNVSRSVGGSRFFLKGGVEF
jgi:hypothetical protein